MELSKHDQLEREAKRLSEITNRQGSQFWKPKLGANVIRILPHWSGEPDRVFFKKVKKHFGVGEQSVQAICRRTLGPDVKCPVCDYVQELRNSGKKEDTDVARDLSAKERFAMNVVDVNDLESGVQIWELGIILFNTLLVLFLDPDYGEMDNLKTGRHLKVNRVGETRYDTRYTIVPAANVSSVDPAVMERVINLDVLENYQVLSEVALTALLEGDTSSDELTDAEEDGSVELEDKDVVAPPTVSPGVSFLKLPGAPVTRATRISDMKKELEKK